MASWTEEEIAAIRAAVLKLATGARTVTVSFAGPPAQTITYAAAQLGELRELLASMERSSSREPGYSLAAFSRGFDQ